MQEQTTQDWSQDFLQEQKPKDTRPKLKIKDGEQVIITFLDEGKEINPTDYGKAILFSVNYKNTEHIWFVNTKKFTLLKEIAHNKPITNKQARITRIGTTKTDTRWKITFQTKEGETEWQP